MNRRIFLASMMSLPFLGAQPKQVPSPIPHESLTVRHAVDAWVWIDEELVSIGGNRAGMMVHKCKGPLGRPVWGFKISRRAS